MLILHEHDTKAMDNTVYFFSLKNNTKQPKRLVRVKQEVAMGVKNGSIGLSQ